MVSSERRPRSRLARLAAIIAVVALACGPSLVTLLLVAARGCTNVQTKQAVVSPSGKYKAEVVSDTGPAFGPIFYWVTVSTNSRWSALPAWLGTAEDVLSISNHGEGLSIEWTANEELTVVCPHCTSDDFAAARTHWREVRVRLLHAAQH